MPRHLPVRVGGYYVRYTVTDDEVQLRDAMIAEHRRQHGGALPSGNETTGRTLRLAARRAA
jgi:hypothetical protein